MKRRSAGTRLGAVVGRVSIVVNVGVGPHRSFFLVVCLVMTRSRSIGSSDTSRFDQKLKWGRFKSHMNSLVQSKWVEWPSESVILHSKISVAFSMPKVGSVCSKIVGSVVIFPIDNSVHTEALHTNKTTHMSYLRWDGQRWQNRFVGRIEKVGMVVANEHLRLEKKSVIY